LFRVPTSDHLTDRHYMLRHLFITTLGTITLLHVVTNSLAGLQSCTESLRYVALCPVRESFEHTSWPSAANILILDWLLTKLAPIISVSMTQRSRNLVQHKVSRILNWMSPFLALFKRQKQLHPSEWVFFPPVGFIPGTVLLIGDGFSWLRIVSSGGLWYCRCWTFGVCLFQVEVAKTLEKWRPIAPGVGDIWKQ